MREKCCVYSVQALNSTSQITYSSCSCSCLISSVKQDKITHKLMPQYLTPLVIIRLTVSTLWKETDQHDTSMRQRKKSESLSGFETLTFRTPWMFVQLTLKFCQFLWYCPGWFFCFCIVVIYPTSVCLVLLPRTWIKLNLTKWYKKNFSDYKKPSKTDHIQDKLVISLHKHLVPDLYMYLSRGLKFCWFLPSRNFGFSVVEVCSTIRCLVLCPWGLLLQIYTQPSQ